MSFGRSLVCCFSWWPAAELKTLLSWATRATLQGEASVLSEISVFPDRFPQCRCSGGKKTRVDDMLVLLSYPQIIQDDLQTSLGFVTDGDAQSSLDSAVARMAVWNKFSFDFWAKWLIQTLRCFLIPLTSRLLTRPALALCFLDFDTGLAFAPDACHTHLVHYGTRIERRDPT